MLPEISIAGFDVEDFDANLKTILQMKVGEVFKLTNHEVHKAGSLWWFEKPKKFIKYPDRMLSDRVKDSVVSLLRRKNIVDFDEVLAEIFIKYPNGLTPDIKLEKQDTFSIQADLYLLSDIELLPVEDLSFEATLPILDFKGLDESFNFSEELPALIPVFQLDTPACTKEFL